MLCMVTYKDLYSLSLIYYKNLAVEVIFTDYGSDW